MEETLKSLGKQIAKLRQKRRLTQEKLAEYTNYSTNHISKLELARTKPSFDILVAISKALNVELKELFNFENDTEDGINQKLKEVIDLSNQKKLNVLYKIYKAIDDEI